MFDEGKKLMKRGKIDEEGKGEEFDESIQSLSLFDEGFVTVDCDGEEKREIRLKKVEKWMQHSKSENNTSSELCSNCIEERMDKRFDQ